MNVGAFGENFPYSNFHDLNTDWIIKIAKDFLDQYTHIQEVITNGEQSLQDLTTDGLEQLQTKADALEALLQQWYNTHSKDIANQLADALTDLNNWYTTHQGYLDQYLTNSIAAFNQAADQKAQQTIASIPADYTTLSNSVDDLYDVIKDTVAFLDNNLLDPSASMTRGFLQSDGTISTAGVFSTYLTTGFIPLESSKAYVVAVEKIADGTNDADQRRATLLYDSNRNIITNSYVNDKNVRTITGGASFIRMSFEASALTRYDIKPVIQQATTLQPYTPYGKSVNKMEIISGYGAADENEFNEIYYEFNQMFWGNMINPDASYVSGAIQSDGSVSSESAYADYFTTDFIPLNPEKTYIGAIVNTSTKQVADERVMYAIYNRNKEVIGYQNIKGIQFTVQNAHYIRYSFSKLNVKKYANIRPVLNEGTVLSYDPYGYKWKNKNDPLYGKVWYACGDSFTSWTTESYDPNDYPNMDGIEHYKTYPFWIGQRTGMRVYNYAVSGQTMAMPANPEGFTNSFSNGKYQLIPMNVDYITLKFGINDSHHAPGSSGGDGEDNRGVIPIGDVTDTGTATFCGAYNTAIAHFIENRPNAKLGIIVSNGCDTDEYRTKTIAIAERWGIPYIDENGESRCPALIRSTNPNIIEQLKNLRLTTWSADYPTNTHPNVEAHKFESTIIEEFLRSL